MNEINKLIKQYERENPGMIARTNTVGDGSIWYDGFVEWLASRPTCGKEQRKFLDELEKMYMDKNMILHKGATIIDQGDFNSDLLKVAKGE